MLLIRGSFSTRNKQESFLEFGNHFELNRSDLVFKGTNVIDTERVKALVGADETAVKLNSTFVKECFNAEVNICILAPLCRTGTKIFGFVRKEKEILSTGFECKMILNFSLEISLQVKNKGLDLDMIF